MPQNDRPSSHLKWNETALWRVLEESQEYDSQNVIGVLKQWMPEVERILSSGGTSPKDFTLHDDQHAARVAQRMAELIPKETLIRLSPYELAFLLMSAYLHDVGMTPEFRKVSLIHRYLLTGEKEDLDDHEVQEFERWLDDDEDGVSVPICSEKPTSGELSRANYLVTHYCRSRHNEWSAEWIIKNSPKSANGAVAALGTYKDWVDDLVRLCKSHHYGRGELESDTFDARPVGQPGQVLNLRYLACILRVSDVLEFDPERTPNVILSHRDTDQESLIYWHKDHAISIVLEGNRIVLSARPSDAKLYRAIEETLNQIDSELLLCRTLADEKHFEVCPGISEKQPHTWSLPAAVHRDLKPKPDTFEYINSSFRPNTKRLLQMLSGIELYGNPLVAVRELLQNAFDAVREQIAYERLRSADPLRELLLESLAQQHLVELRLEKGPEGYKLICTDTGVGMNKQIIENYLLVSGQARRHEIAALERRCKRAGFTSERTGQFGIGVLSFFMIADRLEFGTRRSMEAGDSEPCGWEFETQGVGAWGELRKASVPDRGTRFVLYLKENVIDDPAAWYAQLTRYLEESLVYIPCCFHLNSALPSCEPLSFAAGWASVEAKRHSDILKWMESELVPRQKLHVDLLPSEVRTKQEETNRRCTQLQSEVIERLRWVTEEGSLANKLGRYRLQLPYFELPGGNSLVFFDAEERNGEVSLGSIGKGFSYLPKFRRIHSWKGMEVNCKQAPGVGYNNLTRYSLGLPEYPSRIEVDFLEDAAGNLDINRSSLILSKDGLQAILEVHKVERALMQRFVSENLNSRYTLPNARYCGLTELEISRPEWVVVGNTDSGEVAAFEPVKFPAVDSQTWSYDRVPEKVTWKGKSLHVIGGLRALQKEDHYQGVRWTNISDCPPDRVCEYNSYRKQVGLVWERNPYVSRAKKAPISACRFPPGWKLVSGVVFESGTIWNRGHRLYRSAAAEGFEYLREFLNRSEGLLDMFEELLSDGSGPRAASWLIVLFMNENMLQWKGLLEREPSAVEELWRLVFGKTSTSRKNSFVAVLNSHVAHAYKGMNIIDSKDWRIVADNSEECKRIMPRAERDWTICGEPRNFEIASFLDDTEALKRAEKKSGTVRTSPSKKVAKGKKKAGTRAKKKTGAKKRKKG